jgi:hypothetical protein
LNVQTLAATAPGIYAITITGTGTAATHSTTYTLTVTTPSSLSLRCAGAATSIMCGGSLTSGGAGIGNAQITLTYQPPAGSATVDTATTASDGTFSDTLNAPAGSLLASGTWTVQAQYAGDSTHGPASTTQNVSVP